MPNEADTCRKFVVPKLQAAGWDNEPHSFAEQRMFTKGKTIVCDGDGRRHNCTHTGSSDQGYRVAAELVHELDADGKQLRVVKLIDYTAEKVRTLCASPDELRARWADAGQRADIIHQLAERDIDFSTVAAQAGQPDAERTTFANVWVQMRMRLGNTTGPIR